MKFLGITQRVARAGLALSGLALAGVAAVGLAPANCSCGVDQELTASGGRPVHLRAVDSGPAWEVARVIRVIDGDTYEVLAGGQVRRVRLLGVDAPEVSQPFGQQATDSVRALLGTRLVLLQQRGTDLYGRTLGVVRVRPLPYGGGEQQAPGMALDSVLVVRGWAWAFALGHALASRASQQLIAQRAGRGLWRCGADAPVPPKVWRNFNAAMKRRYLGGCSW